jgi:ribosomal protein S18 acetylase RimI-like enzyme
MQVAPQILPVAEEHLPAIAELAGIIWRACYPGIISPAQIEFMLEQMYSIERLRDEIQRSGICYRRMLVDNELAGFASFGPTEEPHTSKLHKLYLHPKYHHQGLGTLLLQQCERELRAAGVRKLILAVNKQNSKAIHVYQQNGFTIAQSVVVDIGGGFVMDDYVMEKQLN